MKDRSISRGPPIQNSASLKSLGVMSVFAAFLIPVIAVAALALLIFLLSDAPLESLYFFFVGPFRNVYGFGNMVNAAVPLILGALGITIAMKSGNLNLGGEGQIYLGAFCAAAAALAFEKYGLFSMIPAVAAGILAGAAMAAFSGFCKARWNTNELITSFLLALAVIPLVNYLVLGPFLDPETSLISTRKIAEGARLSLILKPSNLNSSFFIAIFLVLFVFFFLYKTKTGYEIRITGGNELFARFGGINTKLSASLAMTISGGFFGLAGALAVLGTYHSVIKDFSSGMGWNGLAAALIAGFSVRAIIPAALFLAWIEAGARAAAQNTDITHEIALVAQAVIFFLCASQVIGNIFSRKGVK